MHLPISKYAFFASSKSAGTEIEFMGKKYQVQELKEDSFDEGFDFAVFSAGGDTSKKFSPIAAKKGCIVVDNSSAFRMDEDVPLVVPEVNPEEISKNKGIIANPNCSTIQAVVALKPLDDKYKIKRVVYSTYQAVSGARKSWN
jgi:aspartate-semialdehyde dehydrogenase